jgi:hypothetical protein
MSNSQMTLLAAVSTVAGFGLLIAHAGDMNVFHRVHHADHPQQRRHEVVLERQLDVNPGGTLRMDVADGDVTVETHEARGAAVTVRVSARDLDWGKEVFERMQFDVRAEGNDLVIEARSPGISGSEWKVHQGGVGIEISVAVPSRFNADILTSDGDVVLENLEGSIRVETSDGDIAAGRLMGRRVFLKSIDGDIHAASLEADHTVLSTRDGDVYAERVAGSLEATTGDGDVSVRLLQSAETTIRTGDGDIEITTVGDFGMSLDLRGQEIYLPRRMQFEGTRRDDSVRGDVNGGGPHVTASTGDGDITVRLNS